MYSLAHSSDSEIAPSQLGSTTLFLFDYDSVESADEYSVFASIQTCLGQSKGVCALNDSGRLGAAALAKFTNQAVGTKAVAGGVVSTRRYRAVAPSVAAMWTDRPENVEFFHDYLNRYTVPRYQGAVLLDAGVSYADFLGFCARNSGLAARSGRVQKIIGTGIDAYHGLVEWLRPRYINARERCARGGFKRIGVAVAALPMLAFVLFLVTRQSPDAPLAAQPVTHETNLAKTIPAARVPAGDLTVGDVPGTVAKAVAVPQAAEALQENRLTDSSPKNLVSTKITVSRSQDAPFTVQVGSFRSSGSARSLVQKLEASGYPAFASTTTLPGGRTMYRVRVGGFQTRKNATLFGEKLKQRERLVTGFFVAANE